MTRDKEIQKAAKEIAQDIEDWEVAEDVQDAFEVGAKWADDHPDDMLARCAMVDGENQDGRCFEVLK